MNEVIPDKEPYFIHYTHIYDLDQKIESIVAAYTRVVGAETDYDSWSKDARVFITRETDQNYYLYIAY